MNTRQFLILSVITLSIGTNLFGQSESNFKIPVVSEKNSRVGITPKTELIIKTWRTDIEGSFVSVVKSIYFYEVPFKGESVIEIDYASFDKMKEIRLNSELMAKILKIQLIKEEQCNIKILNYGRAGRTESRPLYMIIMSDRKVLFGIVQDNNKQNAISIMKNGATSSSQIVFAEFLSIQRKDYIE